MNCAKIKGSQEISWQFECMYYVFSLQIIREGTKYVTSFTRIVQHWEHQWHLAHSFGLLSSQDSWCLIKYSELAMSFKILFPIWRID